jgi:hypothetical protein
VTESPLTRLLRALLLAAAAVVLLGLVAVAAGGYRLSSAGSGEASPYAVDTILTVALAMYAVGAVVLLAGIVWAGLDVRRSPTTIVHKRRRSAAGVFVLLGLLALLVTAHRFGWRLDLSRLHGRPAASTVAPTVPSSAGGKTKAAPSHQRERHFRLAPFLVVFGGAAAAFGALYVAETRRKRRLPREPLVADELVEALDETLEDLRAETDPRRAVIAAYARMERVLAKHGIPRRRFEAPHEYLERVLADLTHGGTAAVRLTALFERARFSSHQIAAATKDEAIEAVEDLQAELAAAEASQAA